MTTSVLLSLMLSVSAPALKDAPKATPSIVGEWVAEKIVHSGQVDYHPETLWYTFTAEGKWVVVRGGKELGGKDRGYTLDPKASPAAVDFTLDRTKADARKILGIYRLDGDTLTLCLREDGIPRPAVFESPAEGSVSLIVFKRVK